MTNFNTFNFFLKMILFKIKPIQNINNIGLFVIMLCGLLQISYASSRDFVFERIKTENGLSQSIVTCMLQDKTGFIWMGTQDGLNRFDGYTFMVYKNQPGNNNTLVNNSISCLLQTADGKLWIGTQRGLCTYHTCQKKWETINFPHFTDQLHITALEADKDENIWIGTAQNGLFVYNRLRDSIEIIHFKTKSGENLHPEITSVYCGIKGLVCVGTQKGLYLIDLQRQNMELVHVPFEPGLAFNMVMDIAGNGTDKIWFLVFERFLMELNITENHINKIETPLLAEEGKLNYGNCLLYNSDQSLWVGMSRATYNYLPAEKKWIEPNDFYKNKPLHDKNAIAICKDNSGSVWVSCWGDLIRLDRSTKRFLSPAYWLGKDDKTANQIITSITEDSDNNLWIGTDDNGIIYWDRAKNEMKHRKAGDKQNGLLNNNIMCLLYDNQGTLWIGTWTGINYLKKKHTKFEIIANTLENQNILPDNITRYIFQDKNNQIWVGTNYGLAHIDPISKRTIKIYRAEPGHENALVNNKINHINQDENGNLWLATDGGISCFNPTAEKWTNYFVHAKKENLSSNNFYQVHFCGNNMLFLTTRGNGIVLFNYKTKKMSVFGEREGMQNQNVYGALFDEKGNAWLTTNKGISVFDPVLQSFKNYDKSHGLISNEFNNNSLFKGSDGIFYFGNIAGLNICKTSEIETDTSSASILLSSVKILNKEANFTGETSCLKKLEIDYTQKIVSFEWAGLYFKNSEKCLYQYKLEGFETEWANNGNGRNATYTNLAPGNYTFKVKCANADGYWSGKIFSLPVSVSAPFWMKTWFHVVLLFSVFILVFSILYLRFLYVKRRNMELEKKVAERTKSLEIANNQLSEEIQLKNKFFHIIAHDLKSPLFGMLELLSRLKSKPEILDSNVLSPQIESLYQSTFSISGLTDRLLQWAAAMTQKIKYQPEPLLMVTLIHCTMEELHPAAMKKNIQVEFEHNGDIIAFADENMVLTILRNLLSNAIKFSFEKGMIRILAESNHDMVMLKIINYGPIIPLDVCKGLFHSGFIQTGTQNEKGTGLGLQICSEFIRQNKGKIGCSSNPTEGTTFWFSIPAMELHAE